MGRYSGTDYTYHESGEDVVMIPICQIRVWDAKQDDNASDKGVIFTEVESIEITDSYKELVSIATIRIPRGSVIAKTMTADNIDKEVKTGQLSNEKDETSMKQATDTGDLVIPGSSVDKSGNPTLSANMTRDDLGFVEMDKSKDRLLVQDDFAIGNRIEIKLGYYINTGNEPDDPDDDIFTKIKTETVPELTTCFRGFISGCSPTTPLEITCKGMGVKLQKKQCPNLIAKKDYTINDLFKSGGTFDLLKNTGLSLSPISESMDINVGKINLSKNLTVADVCDELKKCGLVCFIEPNGQNLRVGRVLYSSGKQEGDKASLRYNENPTPQIIQFDWDVAKDNLSITNIDKNFLAVRAQALIRVKSKKGIDLKTLRVTVRKATSDTEGAIGDFLFTNEHNVQATKVEKKKGGNKNVHKTNVDLDNYTVVPFILNDDNCTMDKLKEAAKNYWKSFSTTGVSGSISIFGDKIIYPSESVMLIDPRQPEKNGLYLVETVTTSFSVDGGYRRELKLPNKIMNYEGKITYIDG